MISRDADDALAAQLRAPAVVTIDLHRGHLDPAVATLPLPADASAALVERVVPLLDRYRARGVPVFHCVTSYRDQAEIVSNPFWSFQVGRPDSTGRGPACAAMRSHDCIALITSAVVVGLIADGIDADDEKIIRPPN